MQLKDQLEKFKARYPDEVEQAFIKLHLELISDKQGRTESIYKVLSHLHTIKDKLPQPLQVQAIRICIASFLSRPDDYPKAYLVLLCWLNNFFPQQEEEIIDMVIAEQS